MVAPPFLLSQELFGGYDGVKLLTGYLRGADQSGVASGLGRHRLLLAATDCVWCTVVGSPVVEDIFLEEGGIFCLLDLLQVDTHYTCSSVNKHRKYCGHYNLHDLTNNDNYY